MRILILLAVVTAALAVPMRNPGSRGSRIVGGSPTTIDQYPYMSNMQFFYGNFFWMQWCGGSLLTSRTILSAAHCYYENHPSQWRVRLGTSLASTGGSVHDVTQFVLHENYDDDTLENDVAIVWLTTPAIFSSVVAVARIAGPAYNLPDDTTVTAIGWGALSSGGFYPEQLQHVNVNIINQQTCTDRYVELRATPGFEWWPHQVDDGMVCAGILDVGGRDACQGDSGGPLSYKDPNGDVVYGVTSWGFLCAHERYPGVNARVSYYADWIVANGSV